MGFIRIALTLSIITQGIFFPTYDVNDYEEDSTKEETEYDEAYQEIYDMLDIEGVEDILSKEGFGDDIRFSDIVIGISNGDGRYVTDTIAKGVKNALVGELLANKSLMLQLVLLVLIGSIFVNISGAFGNAFISENGFYVTYLIITSIMLTSFSLTLDIVSGSIEKVILCFDVCGAAPRFCGLRR